MKKYLFIPALVALLSFSMPVKSENVDFQNPSKAKKSKTFFTVVSRGTIIDNNGEYIVYVDSDAGYYGSFGSGNVTLTIQNLSTSAFFGSTSKLGSISSDVDGDYIDGKTRFIEDGSTKEIFFSGYLN